MSIRVVRGVSLSAVQLELPFLSRETLPVPPAVPSLAVDLVRVRTARRYILRVRPDGSLRVTMPRWGSRAEALRFIESERAWIARQRTQLPATSSLEWRDGTRILFRGAPVEISIECRNGAWSAAYADRRVPLVDGDRTNVRRAIEADLRLLATAYLVPRIALFAKQHELHYARVLVRNQRSRWGSCSRRGTISLNFRLIQLPPEVCDYILIHELMHLRQQNHSRRFWRLVEKACPEFRAAERWLRKHGTTLF